MPWTCPQDGASVDDGLTACFLCGYKRVPTGVILRSEETGVDLPVRIPTTLGYAILRRLSVPDLDKVSREQFRLEPRPDLGGWVVIPLAFAVNPTYLNGAPLDAGHHVLRDGDQLSIKETLCRLTAHLLY
jgi:hypothetical protein